MVWSIDQRVLFESVGLHVSESAKLDSAILLASSQQPSAALSLRALLDHDLNAFGRGFAALGALSSASGNSTVLTGPYFVQIDAMEDAAAPKRRVVTSEDNVDGDDVDKGHRRCLKLRLSDGAHKFDAMEFASLAATIDFDRTPPGSKLVLRNVKVMRGWMLLTPECVQVLGGTVEAMVKVFQFNRSMARRERTLARPVVVRDPGDPGPPQFTLPVDLRTPPKPAPAPTEAANTNNADVDTSTRLPPGLEIPAVVASTTSQQAQARPSAKQKGKFAPMPAVNQNRSASAAAASSAAPAGAVAVNTNNNNSNPTPKASKFAPMPPTNRSSSADASTASTSAPKQKGKFAPMPTKKSNANDKQTDESK